MFVLGLPWSSACHSGRESPHIQVCVPGLVLVSFQKHILGHVPLTPLIRCESSSHLVQHLEVFVVFVISIIPGTLVSCALGIFGFIHMLVRHHKQKMFSFAMDSPQQGIWSPLSIALSVPNDLLCWVEWWHLSAASHKKVHWIIGIGSFSSSGESLKFPRWQSTPAPKTSTNVPSGSCNATWWPLPAMPRNGARMQRSWVWPWKIQRLWQQNLEKCSFWFL